MRDSERGAKGWDWQAVEGGAGSAVREAECRRRLGKGYPPTLGPLHPPPSLTPSTRTICTRTDDIPCVSE